MLSLDLMLAQIVLDVLKNMKAIQFLMLNNYCTTVPRNHALGVSLPVAYSWLSMVLDLAQMVLDVQKNLKPNQFYMLNILCYNNFTQKSSPGGALALRLLLAVYGPGHGPGCPEKP